MSFKNDQLRKVFNRIYEDNVWLCGSGTGSLPKFNIGYIDFLSKFIKDNNIKSILDYGCGDWQFSRKMRYENLVDE